MADQGYMAGVSAAYVAHKATLIVLAVTCVFAFVSMVVSSFAANHIHKSSCSGEADAQSAYKASWRYAVFTAVLSACTAAGIIYLLASYMMKKKAQ